jgi:drug/metabolite transporter (DMT)-like permease
LFSILYGILSAGTWGAADFIGGLASKRTSPYRILFLSEIAGLLPFTALALLTHESFPSSTALLLGAGSSLLGLTGLLLLYRALADGRMTIAAPVSALFSALVPVVFGSFTLGLPSSVTLAGFLFALLAIWFISQTNSPGPSGRGLRSLALPLLSGLFFGFYFIIIHEATRDSLFWPLVAARCMGVLAFGLYALTTRQQVMPPPEIWGLSILNGVLDIGGNAFYVLAANVGRIDVAAVLGALYPASTVVLAWIVLKERLTWLQAFGVLLAFVAIVLFTL